MSLSHLSSQNNFIQFERPRRVFAEYRQFLCTHNLHRRYRFPQESDGVTQEVGAFKLQTIHKSSLDQR